MSDDDQPCFFTFVYTAVVLLFACPVYIYLLTEWHTHRKHFVIRNRWPIISLIVVAMSISTQILTLFESVFCLSNLNPFAMGLSNAIQGLVYYRTYLLYARTMKTRQYLTVTGPKMILNGNKQCSTSPHMARIILSTISITSILIIWGRSLGLFGPVYTSFTITLFIGIVCLIQIIRHKVKDSIAITRECMVQIVTTFTMLVTVACASTFAPSHTREIATCMGILANISYGVSTLFIPYNLIRRANVSADRTLPLPSPVASKSTVELHQSTGLNLNIPKDTDPVDNKSITVLHRPSLSQWIHKPLSLFLKDNSDNLSLFIGYLGECFALENMLFLERAIILHHLIKKYQGMDTAHTMHPRPVSADDQLQFKTMCAKECYELQFMELNLIYNDIEAIIKDGCEDNVMMMYKRGIVKAMELIYRQFCHRDSDMEINIAFDIQHRLCVLFEGDADDRDTLPQFTRYEDLLMVYHDAILQCWSLCVSIYGFQFKAYLRENVIKEKQ
eukprot:214854_1